MSKPSNTRRKGARLAVLGAVAAFATMAFGAGTANAVPTAFGTAFDDGHLKTTFPGNGFDVVADGVPVTFGGEIETDDGSFVIPPGCEAPVPPDPIGAGFCFPAFDGEVTTGVEVAVALESLSPIQGQLVGGIVAPTGAVTTQPAEFLASIAVTFGGAAPQECVIGNDPNTAANETAFMLQFSTATTAFPNPYNGDPFTVNVAATPPLQDGAIAANWAALPAGVGPGCTFVNQLTSGPGGLRISEGLPGPVVNQPTGGGGGGGGGGEQPNTDAFKKCMKKAQANFKKAKKKAKTKKAKKKAVKKKKAAFKKCRALR